MPEPKTLKVTLKLSVDEYQTLARWVRQAAVSLGANPDLAMGDQSIVNGVVTSLLVMALEGTVPAKKEAYNV